MLFAGIHLPDAGKRALLRLSLVGDEDVKFMDLEGSSFEKVFEHLRMQLGLVRRS